MAIIRAELVNPFIKASKDIMVQMAKIDMNQEKPFVKKGINLEDNIGVVIGFTGQIKGQVVISFSEDIGKQIASNMMGGMPVAEIDDMAKSAISELGNMILGNSATSLYDLGIKVDITPPSILKGKDMKLSSFGQTIVCIPFDTEGEKVELNISVKE